MFETPILFNIFNRPETTQQVFDAIKKIQPTFLFVHADGPRPGNVVDAQRCETTRNIILQQVDWECELKTLFRDENLGCGVGPASAITWFFENVKEGIILEDDCLPHIDFFRYCSELLEKYRDNSSIAVIGGSSFNEKDSESRESYRFTHFASIWGWATWKKTWDKYDFNPQISVREFEQTVFPLIKSRDALNHWSYILKMVHADTTKTYWDYQLHLQLLIQGAVSIKPNRNLITNIGFGEDATHTRSSTSEYSNRQTKSILPLVHPKTISIDTKKDAVSFKIPLFTKIKRSIYTFIQHVK